MYTLLLVDDDLEILEMLTLGLAGPGVRLLTAQTVAQAEYAMEYYRVDAAVLDVHLTSTHEREGLEVLRLLQQTYPGVEAIVMSGSDDPSLMNRAYRAGAWTFLRKPLELAELERYLTSLGFPSTRWGFPDASVGKTRAATSALQSRSVAV